MFLNKIAQTFFLNLRDYVEECGQKGGANNKEENSKSNYDSSKLNVKLLNFNK